MSARLIDLLLGLSRRERLLLAALAGLVLPLALGFGVLLPLRDARDRAEATQAEAVALQGWVMARVAEKQALDGARPHAAPPGPPIGSSALEQALIAAKLRRAVSELGASGQGGIELRFDRVDFLRLATWLSAMHPGWGYEIESFRFEARDEPGVVAAWLSLVPGGG